MKQTSAVPPLPTHSDANAMNHTNPVITCSPQSRRASSPSLPIPTSSIRTLSSPIYRWRIALAQQVQSRCHRATFAARRTSRLSRAQFCRGSSRLRAYCFLHWLAGRAKHREFWCLDDVKRPSPYAVKLYLRGRELAFVEVLRRVFDLDQASAAVVIDYEVRKSLADL
jgi:hypothetical protein